MQQIHGTTIYINAIVLLLENPTKSTSKISLQTHIKDSIKKEKKKRKKNKLKPNHHGTTVRICHNTTRWNPNKPKANKTHIKDPSKPQNPHKKLIKTKQNQTQLS